MPLEDVKQYAKTAKNGKHYVSLLIGKKEKTNTEKLTGLLLMNTILKQKKERSAKQATEKHQEDGKALLIPVEDD